jgi:serine/threonine protein kinase
LTLTPGSRLGVSDITAQIGEGGMGRVYRATDTKLKRQDGRFVVVRDADPEGTREIVLVQHWFEELKRLVPMK